MARSACFSLERRPAHAAPVHPRAPVRAMLTRTGPMRHEIATCMFHVLSGVHTPRVYKRERSRPWIFLGSLNYARSKTYDELRTPPLLKNAVVLSNKGPNILDNSSGTICNLHPSFYSVTLFRHMSDTSGICPIHQGYVRLLLKSIDLVIALLTAPLCSPAPSLLMARIGQRSGK